MLQKSIFAILLVVFFSVFAQAQSVIGVWKTIDDESGEAKSYVTLYMENGKVYGKITKLLLKDPETTFCEACKGDLKDKKVQGMVILTNLHEDGKYWKGGKILDPNNGKVYTCKIWLDSKNKDKLNVRGYIGPFYRTQEWFRIK